MTEELSDQIRTWLNSQGYGLEMEVAEYLASAGFDMLKSYFYEDPETKTSREIDVIGRITDTIGLLSVYSIIECKKSLNPWVVFTSENAGFNRVHSFAIMTNDALNAVANHNHVPNLLNIDWFKKPGRLGYGIAQALSSKSDKTFEAVMSVTKASFSYLAREEEAQTLGFLSFFFPTVVLGGRLFESYLGENNTAIVTEVDSSFLQFPIRIGKRVGSSVRIVTIKAFERYCNELKSVYHFLKKELSDEENMLYESIKLIGK
jgi:hypothetical protein